MREKLRIEGENSNYTYSDNNKWDSRFQQSRNPEILGFRNFETSEARNPEISRFLTDAQRGHRFLSGNGYRRNGFRDMLAFYLLRAVTQNSTIKRVENRPIALVSDPEIPTSDPSGVTPRSRIGKSAISGDQKEGARY